MAVMTARTKCRSLDNRLRFDLRGLLIDWQCNESMPLVKSRHKCHQLIHAGRLYDVAVGAQFISALDVRLAGGRCQDIHCQTAASRILADPIPDLEAIHSKHNQNEQKNIRKRIHSAIAISALSRQICQRLQTIGDRMQYSASACLLEGVLEKKDVVGIIFGKQNVQPAIHERHQAPICNFPVGIKGRWRPTARRVGGSTDTRQRETKLLVPTSLSLGFGQRERHVGIAIFVLLAELVSSRRDNDKLAPFDGIGRWWRAAYPGQFAGPQFRARILVKRANFCVASSRTEKQSASRDNRSTE